MDDWNARQYLKFEDERTRPPRDLLAQVPSQNPRLAVDLGCGPGNSTELLLRAIRNPKSSASIRRPTCCKKRASGCPDHIHRGRYRPLDAGPARRSSVCQRSVSMDTGSSERLRRLLEALPPGGVLAVQMPDNTREPSHTLQREVAANGPWADNPEIRAAARGDLPSPEVYYDLLKPVCARIDIWHSIYEHVLATPQAIVEWFKGSALQPFLAPLGAAAREQFLAAYLEKIAATYRPRFDGKVLLKFPRLFIVATR